jgi:hypothetical protein
MRLNALSIAFVEQQGEEYLSSYWTLCYWWKGWSLVGCGVAKPSRVARLWRCSAEAAEMSCTTLPTMLGASSAEQALSSRN